jgi:sialate O-acetylesterase
MKKTIRFSMGVILLLISTLFAKANVSLPAIFGDNMVLQQKSEVTFWGWAKPFEEVSISTGWSTQEVKVTTGNQGTWELKVTTPFAGGPYKIKITGYNEIILQNVLIGEVWLCSGQSNMEWTATAGIDNQEEEIKNANFPKIRFFTVNHQTALHPQINCQGKWIECTPETMKDFSAVAYFFGRKINRDLNVPIGLINSSWGGTPAETWIPENVIQNDEYLKKAAAKQQSVPWGPVEPARIYNAMIAPIMPFTIAGTLWYQGEGNAINGSDYQELLTALIKSWRAGFKNDFPFYFAQIAPYKYGKPFEGVVVREEQRKVLEVPKTGMVVTSDIGDTTDIHPRNKLDVGIRFANLALNRHYKAIDEMDSGPLFKSMEIKNNKAIVSFGYDKGLYAKDETITCFEIAGEDKVYYPAEAKIKDDKVIVESKEVKKPKFVRFAWRNTATPNLFNAANLPASCFSTE